MKNFKTYQLSLQFYQMIQPCNYPCHMRDQLLRAASSICLNLAEGYGKLGDKDKAKFYQISMGSLREVQAILDLTGNKNPNLTNLLNCLIAHLYQLIRVQRAKIKS